MIIIWSLIPLSAIIFFLISANYFRKSTEGLEKQLKPAFWAFLLLGLAEVLSISELLSQTSTVFWSKLFAEFGIIWIIQHAFKFAGVLILALWVWGYIRFRLQTQLFVMTFAISLIIFLATTTLYTALLLRNLEAETLAHLKTDVSVLQYSLKSLQERTLAQTQAIAQDSDVKKALVNNDKSSLYLLATDFMVAQKNSTLVIASPSGSVVTRAEDNERTNDNISVDPIFVEAINGRDQVTVAYKPGILYPEISVKAASPIREGSRSSGKIIGVVVNGFVVDSAFVDGVDAVTGLDVTIFGKDKRAATTFVAPDGKSRFVGTLETNKDVLDTVLTQGKKYIGSGIVLNQPFYTAYSPLKTIDNKIIGMLFVGKLQNTLTEVAQKSMDLTYFGSIILICLTLIPVYLLSKFIEEQIGV